MEITIFHLWNYLPNFFNSFLSTEIIYFLLYMLWNSTPFNSCTNGSFPYFLLIFERISFLLNFTSQVNALPTLDQACWRFGSQPSASTQVNPCL